jgi:replication initiation and membrane attachment protein DnaB
MEIACHWEEQQANCLSMSRRLRVVLTSGDEWSAEVIFQTRRSTAALTVLRTYHNTDKVQFTQLVVPPLPREFFPELLLMSVKQDLDRVVG